MAKIHAATMAVALLLAAVVADSADAQRLATGCADGVLDQTQSGADLELTVPCTVKAGIYKFKDVHILAKGELIFTDAKIDFWAANILVENKGKLIAGSPDAPIGTNGGVVTIHLWGADANGSDPNKQGRGIPCMSDKQGQCGVA